MKVEKPRFHDLPSYVEYELLKAQWAANNPQATPQEYEQAMLRIAQQCGV